MPICPGCGQYVPYQKLRNHVQLCKWLWSDTPKSESGSNEQLAARLESLETKGDPDWQADIRRRLTAIEERLTRLEAKDE